CAIHANVGDRKAFDSRREAGLEHQSLADRTDADDSDPDWARQMSKSVEQIRHLFLARAIRDHHPLARANLLPERQRTSKPHRPTLWRSRVAGAMGGRNGASTNEFRPHFSANRLDTSRTIAGKPNNQTPRLLALLSIWQPSSSTPAP